MSTTGPGRGGGAAYREIVHWPFVSVGEMAGMEERG